MSNAMGGEGPVANRQYSNSFLFFGIILLILGIIAVGSQFVFTIGTVIFFGALLLVAGVTELIHIIVSKQHGRVIFNVLSSIAYIVAGAFTLWNPLLGALSLTLIMGAFFIAAGALRISYGLFHRHEAHWFWFVLGGVVTLLLGLMITLGWPATGLWMIGLFVGIEMIFHGTAWIMLAIVLKGNQGKAS